MNVKLFLPELSGVVSAPTSKSELHRYLIFSAFADMPTVLYADTHGDDILATVDVIRALGAEVVIEKEKITVTPTFSLPKTICVNCHASASTLRFFIPIVAALGVEASFLTEGELINRPIAPYAVSLAPFGVSITKENNAVTVKGKLTPGDYEIDASLSSQFLSGMLFSLSLLPSDSTLKIKGKSVSAPYVNMTQTVRNAFGDSIVKTDSGYVVKAAKIHSPGDVRVGGDYSAAAFFLVGGAIGSHPITVKGLAQNSLQGDAAILKVLKTCGAHITRNEDAVTVYGTNLCPFDMDIKDTPDLFVPLSVLAACAEGQSRFYGVDRLRYKESDRLLSVGAMLSALGIKTAYENDVFTVFGGQIHGGDIDSFSDHRIAMSAAVAATRADGPVLIRHGECIKKSYPDFFSDYQKLLISEKTACQLLSESI